MPRKVPPRWDYDEIWDVPDFERRDRNVDNDALLQALGYDAERSDETWLGRLNLCMTVFHRDQLDVPAPSEEEIDAALAEVKAASERFATCLRRLDRSSLRWLGAGFEIVMKDVEPGSPVDEIAMRILNEREAFSEVVERFGRAADTAPRRSRTTRRGRRGNPAIKALICDLAYLYEENWQRPAVGGFRFDPVEERYGGPFFRPVYDFLTAFAPELGLSNHAVGEHIRRAIGDRSRR